MSELEIHVTFGAVGVSEPFLCKRSPLLLDFWIGLFISLVLRLTRSYRHFVELKKNSPLKRFSERGSHEKVNIITCYILRGSLSSFRPHLWTPTQKDSFGPAQKFCFSWSLSDGHLMGFRVYTENRRPERYPFRLGSQSCKRLLRGVHRLRRTDIGHRNARPGGG